MSQSHELTRNSVPLLGICDIAMHRLRPVVVAIERSEAGRKEFEVLMVCSRCGYAREARQLRKASEELASEVVAEVNRQMTDEPGGSTDSDDDVGDGGADAEENRTDSKSRRPPPKKIN